MKKRACVGFEHLICKDTSIEVLHPFNDFNHLLESCSVIVYVSFYILKDRGIPLSRIPEIPSFQHAET